MIEIALEEISLLYKLPLKSTQDVDEALSTVAEILPDYLFSFDHAGESEVLRSSLLERSGTLLLKQETFDIQETILIGKKSIPLRDALNMIGFSYSPALSPSLSSKGQMSVVAGRWHIERLPAGIKLSKKAANLLLYAQQATVSGTSSGVLFEKPCCEPM